MIFYEHMRDCIYDIGLDDMIFLTYTLETTQFLVGNLEINKITYDIIF